MKRKLSLNPAANRYQVAPRQAMQPKLTASQDIYPSKVAGSPMQVQNLQVSPGQAGSTRRITVGIENGEVTDETFIFSSDNEGGLIGILAGAVAPKGGVVISGSKGTNSYDVLGKYANVGVLVKSVHMNNTNAGAASTGFYDSGTMNKTTASDPSANRNQSNVPLSSLVDGADQNTNIRKWEEPQGFLLSEISGYEIVIPAGEKVVFTIEFELVGQGYLMGAVQ